MPDNKLPESVFEATLCDACASAHLMRIDEADVNHCDTTLPDDHTAISYTVIHMVDFSSKPRSYYDSKPADHIYTFKDGKTTFTDSDEVVRTVEVFSLIPMVSLKEQ